MEKLVLIDGNSLINRAFYAMPLLTNKNGDYTNAVFGFMNMFFKMVDDVKPTYVAVAFDLKAPTFRHKMYTEYKGTRKPMPEELRPQLPILKEVLTVMGVKTIEKEGYEADDIIGTIAKNTDIQTIIITGDKDSFQLVDEQTDVYFTKRGITELNVYTAQNFTEKTGLIPSQIIELKALMGDASDNIPGVSGVGEKTAISLLQRFSTVDGVYANLERVKGKLKERIEAEKEICYLSRRLATIKTDCEIDLDVEKMRLNLPFSAEVKEKFAYLGFKSIISKAHLFESGENEAKEQTELTNQAEFIENAKLEEVKFNDYSIISVYFNEQAYYISNGSVEYKIALKQNLLTEGEYEESILSFLPELLNKAQKVLVFSKKEFRHKIPKLFTSEIIAKTEDYSIAKYLADYTGRAESLQEIITGGGYEVTGYATFMLNGFLELYKTILSEELENLYKEIELPLADLLYEMEERGFKLDLNAIIRLGEEYVQEISLIEKRIREYAEQPELNVNSPRQLGDVIFEKLKLGKAKKGKYGYSTSAEILEGLIDTHPIISLILRYRQLQKLNSTYIEGFKPLIDKKTGLIKTSFNQTVTSTGRLSSKEPNLQNIPIRDEEGKKLRKFFVPRDSEHILVSADYSQIELRLLADFAKCNSLITAFNSEQDVHASTASKVFNIPLNKVTAEKRRMAKAVNFGIIYGISEYGLAKNIKSTAKEAREYIEAYFKQYPEVKEYMDANVKFAKEKGYAITIMGRRRYIGELKSSNYMTRQFGERAAMNMPLQGSSADIIKIAMLNVDKKLKEAGLKSRLILTIHDELIVDALKSERAEVEEILVNEMQNAVSLSVKLTVSKSCGENWYDAK